MTASSERLRELAPLQDVDLETQDVGGARDRFVQAGAARRRAPRATLLAAAAIVAAALFVVALWPKSGALTFAVGTSDGRVGAWIAAGAEETVPVRFSDGTSVVLRPAARARVVAADTRGARVLLESGTIEASVTHTDTSAWSFDAGPLEVRVTGTRFDASWDPTKQVLRLVLHEGSVAVTGSCLAEVRSVVAGQTLDVSCKEQRVELTEGPPGAPSKAGLGAPSSPSPSPSPSSSQGPPPVESAPAAPPASAVSVASTWREALRAHRYGEAMRAAEDEGFDGLVTRSSASDLLALADVARFAGKTSRAVEALSAVRARFGGSSEAARAAFHLGRIAFDQRGAHAEAARWFSTYLAEQPGGAFAQEALGRLIECRESMGATSDAQDAARRYLASYPNGPHAERAKRLVAGD